MIAAAESISHKTQLRAIAQNWNQRLGFQRQTLIILSKKKQRPTELGFSEGQRQNMTEHRKVNRRRRIKTDL